jgi:hypothetical protein
VSTKASDAPPKATKRTLPFPQDGFDIKARATAERRGKKGRFYKPLATQFRHDGFDYRQIAREGNAAIYEQRWPGCSEPNACYEVVRIRRRDGFQIGERFVEPAEVYPRGEQWGELGWTVPDKESAFRKLRELVNAPQKESANPVKKSPIQNTKRCSESIELRGDVKNRRDG